MRPIAAISAALLLLAAPFSAEAQTRSESPSIDPSAHSFMRIRDAANRPCVTLKSVIRPNAINKTEIEHLIVGTNGCPKTIEIKACYQRSTRCVEFTLPSYGNKQALLGVMSNVYSFQFDFTEKAAF